MPIQIYDLNLDKKNRELEVRGTPLFPCGAYFSDIINNVTGDIPWHWHDEFEVIVIKKGPIKISVSGTDYLLQTGEGLFINSNVLHSVYVFNDQPCLLNSLVFHKELICDTNENIFKQRYIQPLANCNALPSIPLYPHIKWQRIAIDCILTAYEAYESEKFGYELFIRNQLSHLFYLLVKHHQEALQQPQIENQEMKRLKKMLNFIHENYSKGVEVGQIAASANISIRECQRCFQKHVQMSPMQYLLKYRISVSAGLLFQTDATITEICNKVGFDSPSYYTKIFKRFMNTSPTAYRKKTIVR
ncbi:AraC family transcriptional regulator [Turicibacter sanguinis]|uniref:AraC family transcriptional regulator n=1 Tax=Turicibacter sanguinis TaxID=154288 RepID=UPI00232CDB83|nr:AraC family transcriptional regulator [Turicibacter sanguinis]MDB8575734.1 AraC family transcriptional regulator [Turicibacter sanguinis]MDB8578161.1 AraC family transcriptional regulator [Turicibacter sanguinis]MDB8584118.1 AraC family transcriptional regulator [Turicibacter sanguinis]MDB8587154.1 AraC family transcriptional regulator [Turicibacter sanguinis]MDB8598020.1 AraC family transcriptional regulator [Turicibacter sanguinis]